MSRDVLQEFKSGHLLASALQTGEANDLDESVDLVRDALVLCPSGHSDRSTSLNDLKGPEGRLGSVHLVLHTHLDRPPSCQTPNAGNNHAVEGMRFVAISQAKAAGANELLSVGTELANIGQCATGPAVFTSIEGRHSPISRVEDELGKREWVHFVCHGIPNRKQPFESAFALHDGPFTIQHIMRCNLENPEFAYLSACHTTVGDEESPDEAIHLAFAMLFAGFLSVIGTMWAVDDAETNKVTSIFYKHMLDVSGRLDYTRAAFALWKTMRLVNIPMDQRILYVHLGV